MDKPKVSLKTKKNNPIEKPKIISSYTKKDNYFKQQYNKYIDDPSIVLNVVTIKEQIYGYELSTEIEYLQNLKRQLKHTPIDKIIKNAKELDKSNNIINYEFVNTTHEFKDYFEKKIELDENYNINLEEKKRNLERLRSDMKKKKIKNQKKKLYDVNLNNDQKKVILKDIEDIKKNLINEPVLNIENKLKNKFYDE
jgi:exonuclease VII large subunit